jgi:hypothetical protein
VYFCYFLGGGYMHVIEEENKGMSYEEEDT